MTTPPHPKDRIPKEFIITENQLNDLVTGHLDIEDELRIMEFVRSRPTSHTSSHRIEQVIKELVDLEAKSLSTCDTAFGYREGLKTAIALLREGAP